jgi:hypothetical protein
LITRRNKEAAEFLNWQIIVKAQQFSK